MATILVGSKYIQDLELNITVNNETKELKKVIIKGSKHDAPMGQHAGINNEFYGAATFTSVDEDFFTQWQEENKGSKLLSSGIIFTAKTEASAKAIKKERAEVNTGLEGLKVEKTSDGGEVKDIRAKRA